MNANASETITNFISEWSNLEKAIKDIDAVTVKIGADDQMCNAIKEVVGNVEMVTFENALHIISRLRSSIYKERIVIERFTKALKERVK